MTDEERFLAALERGEVDTVKQILDAGVDVGVGTRFLLVAGRRVRGGRTTAGSGATSRSTTVLNVSRLSVSVR